MQSSIPLHRASAELLNFCRVGLISISRKDVLVNGRVNEEDVEFNRFAVNAVNYGNGPAEVNSLWCDISAIDLLRTVA